MAVLTEVALPDGYVRYAAFALFVGAALIGGVALRLGAALRHHGALQYKRGGFGWKLMEPVLLGGNVVVVFAG